MSLNIISKIQCVTDLFSKLMRFSFRGYLDWKSVRRQITALITKIVSEYDQEIPQSQTADNPVAPRGKAAQRSRDTRETN